MVWTFELGSMFSQGISNPKRNDEFWASGDFDAGGEG